MPQFKAQVRLMESALKDFKVIQNYPDVFLIESAQQHLKALIEFPLKDWLGVRQHWPGGIFKLGVSTPFDIQGKVSRDPIRNNVTVLITRFRLKETADRH